jgi:hypothetical protein
MWKRLQHSPAQHHNWFNIHSFPQVRLERTELPRYAPKSRAVWSATVQDKVIQFRRQAQDCEDRAEQARHVIDRDAWLKLADEWQVLARTEAAEDIQNPTAVSGRHASE